MVTIRQAAPKDANAAVEVVRRSIEELCAADHRNDEATLAKWLANKTPENFCSWIFDPDNFCVIAVADGKVSGVGLVHRSSEIRLLYLAPGSQRRNMGRAIHAALEEKTRAWGLRKLHLDSTFWPGLSMKRWAIRQQANPSRALACCIASRTKRRCNNQEQNEAYAASIPTSAVNIVQKNLRVIPDCDGSARRLADATVRGVRAPQI